MTFLIRSNLLISFAAVSYYLTGHWLMNKNFNQVSWLSILAIFTASFFIYNIPKLHISSLLRNDNLLFKLAFIFNLLVLIIVSYNIQINQAAYLLHLGIISFLYNFPYNISRIPFVPVRSIPFIKIVLIAYVWASIGSVYCSFEVPSIKDHEVVIIFIVQFLFIISITLPFDIRDYIFDKKKGIKTIPGLIGIRWTKYLGYALALAYTLFASITLSSLQAFIITGIVIILSIKNSGEHRNEFYYTGLIDGFIIVNLLLILVLY